MNGIRTLLNVQDLEALQRRAAGTTSPVPASGFERQPVHTVYGGAHLFRADTAPKLGAIALQLMRRYAPDPSEFARALGTDPADETAKIVHRRVHDKLTHQPVEDYRIDFEDGYGERPDAEEDEHAARCARELARGIEQATLPPFIGFRIKSFARRTRRRALRTLDVFLSTLAEATDGVAPPALVVALPKVSDRESVESFVASIEMLEQRCGFDAGSVRIELMIETTRAIIGDDGNCPLPDLVRAAGGRCAAAHFGAYDYTAACEITAASQRLHHEACVFARQMMHAALAGTGVRLVDGATNLLPVEPHRSHDPTALTETQRRENEQAVHSAWRLGSDNIRRSLAGGFYQGWDLHPGQLPVRFAATYRFFLEGAAQASARLRQFIDRAAQATRLGGVFDDAATGQGLLNFFHRALDCGAIHQDQLDALGLSEREVRTKSFLEIIATRQRAT